ncbi:MAG: sn-glycerol-3-phosphate ABC transporter ATP-binding protein UgpC [Mesorhizobium sp.]|uniref:ABC transporter ATP-binding protein n=1 Tax=Mesorhizobium sp. TaxID=1871066 RepID=UPI000FEA477F|nr:sn-glycerol-3-phosphate ABC transporter ATP-binding protein UgpC [Mesorhizobium sp.]RWB73042.1 MAG: sn-glycerol-3-phosphate ABC transporter ATP-binding protein UgpC [Mesorhizobium sp.]TIP38593.1 MAG: sn-glycerol-3-phosphate ABC transporter ATP-binding protein UgpC [Mesorhizobium sp.]
MASIRLDKVWKKFGTTEVIKGIDMSIREGEFIVLVGPSGCGKSTLLNLIAGLETLSGGEIFIGSDLVNDIPPKDRDIAMVFQSYALYPTKSVRDNMNFGMVTRHVPQSEQTVALAEVAGLLHIETLLDRKPGQLSGGQRQRVAMGRALVRKPAVFLFDEPLSNLDAKLRIEMRTEIKRLHQRLGKTIVYVTHDQIEAMTLASRIAVMDNGHIRQFGSPEDIYERPVDLFVAGFVGSPSMNLFKGRVVEQSGLRLQVDDPAGAVHFPIPRNLHDAARPYLGRELILGLRPEAMVREGAHRPGSETFSFDRTIDVVEPTGPDTLLVFTLGGIEAIGRVDPQDKISVGTKFRFDVDMGRAKMFDPVTGLHLASVH